MRVKITIEGKKTSKTSPDYFEDITLEEFGKMIDIVNDKGSFDTSDIFNVFFGIDNSQFDNIPYSQVTSILSCMNFLDTFNDDAVKILKSECKKVTILDKDFDFKKFSGKDIKFKDMVHFEQVCKLESYSERVACLIGDICFGDYSKQDVLLNMSASEVVPLFNFFIRRLRITQSISFQRSKRVQGIYTTTTRN
jgi:hypothetical protein